MLVKLNIQNKNCSTQYEEYTNFEELVARILELIYEVDYLEFEDLVIIPKKYTLEDDSYRECIESYDRYSLDTEEVSNNIYLINKVNMSVLCKYNARTYFYLRKDLTDMVREGIICRTN